MSKSQQVISRDGLRGVISPEIGADAGRVTVSFEDGRSVIVPIDLLERADDGTYRLSADMGELKARGGDVRPTVLPVIEETVDIDRERVTTGIVRIHKRVQEHDEVIDEAIMRDEVSVERVPVEKLVETPPEVRREGDTVIIPVLEEVLVVERRLMLKEEVRITRRRVEERKPQRVSLRREEVEIERLPAEGRADKSDPAAES